MVLDYRTGKKCALICVEEIIKELRRRGYTSAYFQEVKKEMDDYQKVLADYFQVDSPQALKEQLDERKRMKEREEEGRLSKIELAEKKARDLQKEKEEDRIRFEQREQDLISQRDKIIIQNALIQAAVANDVANPKQLLKLLENEFFVDPDRLVPMYKAEDGLMPLEERVQVFLNEPDNWNLVSAKIAAGSGTKGGSTTAHGRKVWSRAEIKKLRNEDPAAYKAQQEEIQAAYREGRVR